MGDMFGKILSVILKLVGVGLFLSGVYDFFDWFGNADLTIIHLRIATAMWILMGIVVFVLGHSIRKFESSQRVLLVVGAIVLVLIGWVIIRVYPRDISLSVKGVEYKLGSPQGGKPVTLQLNGTLQTSLLGTRKFDGTVSIYGVTTPNPDNKMTVQFFSNSILGGPVTYVDSKTQQVNEYGAIYSNRNFNEFTIIVFQLQGKGSGWSGADGLMISAPAKNRTQALQVSNDLMKARLLRGHPLR